ARKHILEYDDVMNQHRSLVYKKRQEILSDAYHINIAEEIYRQKEKELGPELMKQVERFVSLNTLDTLWMNHLEDMEYLRDSVRLRAYGQKDPLVEYKNESQRLFKDLMANFEAQTAMIITKVQPQQQNANFNANPTPIIKAPNSLNIGRNDPCPCGSGKKFKKCCGK
ncbi:MAG: SEC-C metal-binding domain-containing protein, partial [Patescibacteria group bacterium]